MKYWTITPNKFLNEEQIESLLTYLKDQRDLSIARGKDFNAIKSYYIFHTFLETGLRVAEFSSLKNSDINGLKLVVRRGKGGKPRTVLLTRSTVRLLREWLAIKEKRRMSLDPESPLFPNAANNHYTTRALQKRIKKVLTALNFPKNLSVHSLRHTYASVMLMKNVPITVVKENLGHSSLIITTLYSHAIGSIEEVELYDNKSSQNYKNYEQSDKETAKKINNYVKKFLEVRTNIK